jgi:class 3 adenylate cyclase/pimeloyl-ACP methyl ester carboxylesterase
MDPQIRYATTADGISIAYWVMGDGPTIVHPPPAMPWSHIELEWQIPEWRHWYEHLTETYRIVRYDNRGAGLSTRDVTEISLNTHVLDLDAVVAQLGLEPFSLFAFSSNASVAIRYAILHPDRVSHLMLWCALIDEASLQRSPAANEALERLLDVDYELFAETFAHTAFGWSEGEAAHRFATYMQQSLSHELARTCWGTFEKMNALPLLSKIQQPTLVLHRREFPMLDVDSSRRIAARIPDARLKILEGASISPYIGDMQSVLDVIDDFLGIDAAEAAKRRKTHVHAPPPQHSAAGGFRTIMFTDMEGSTALTQRLGDEQAQERVRLHNVIVGEALAMYGGSQVKHTGDGIMASFPTASSAVECGIAIQQAFERHNRAHPDERISIRIGLNAGEPVAEGDDLFGTAVQLASRVCGRAEPGEVLTSDVVRQLVAGKGFLFSDRGTAELRGFEDPVRLYEVRWREGHA